jgi:hypothetical protein
MAHCSTPAEITTKELAISTFKALVSQYGLQWTAAVPSSAYDLMAACNKFLDEGDRREALGLRR